MKKILLNSLLLITAITLVTGCGNSNNQSLNNNSKNKNNTSSNKLTCTKTETDEDGYETNSTVTITSKNGKVVKATQEDINKMDESIIEASYSFGKIFAEAFKKIDGISASYEKVDSTTLKSKVEVDYTKINIDKLKETLGDAFTGDSIYSKSDITLDDFKKNYLDNYDCK